LRHNVLQMAGPASPCGVAEPAGFAR
jgi:hypothetical protein